MKNQINREIKDKLNRAFKILRVTYGYLAKQNFMCCGGCAWSATSEIVKTKPNKYRGVVFYDKQDVNGLKMAYPYCWIAYSSSKLDDTPEATVAVGSIVRHVMESVGLKVKWNENPNTRILVTL